MTRQILKQLSDEDLNDNPVMVFGRAIQTILKDTGNSDPLIEMKRERNRKAWPLLSRIEEIMKDSEDRLLSVLKCSASGNVLDIVAVDDDSRLESSLKKAFEEGFAREEYREFRKRLESACEIFYITDNSGEIVFDRPLISMLKSMGKSITCCVRGKPAMDDALEEDFRFARLDEFADLVDTGAGFLGLVLEFAPEETLNAFRKADLVISKGMGNLETLMDLHDERIFFLFKAKCERIAGVIGVKKDDFCFVRQTT